MGMNFADCYTNWNFEFARTAEIFNTKFANRLKKCQRLLSPFADVCYFFIINDYYYVSDVYHVFGKSWGLGFGLVVAARRISVDRQAGSAGRYSG